jgi:hypothetical protein
MMQLDPMIDRVPEKAGTKVIDTCWASVKSDSSCGEEEDMLATSLSPTAQIVEINCSVSCLSSASIISGYCVRYVYSSDTFETFKTVVLSNNPARYTLQSET